MAWEVVPLAASEVAVEEEVARRFRATLEAAVEVVAIELAARMSPVEEAVEEIRLPNPEAAASNPEVEAAACAFASDVNQGAEAAFRRASFPAVEEAVESPTRPESAARPQTTDEDDRLVKADFAPRGVVRRPIRDVRLSRLS